jgi:uncharacterized protein involved in response to NO
VIPIAPAPSPSSSPAPPSGATLPPPPGLEPRAPWRWARLATAPHRLAFFAGGVALAVTALWWAAMLALRHAGVATPWAVVPPVAHGLLMAVAFNPLFMVGFLFTAGPRWLGLPDVPGTSLVRAVAGYAAGMALLLLGVHLHALLAAAGLLLAAGVWAGLLRRFGRLVAVSRVPDTLHARAILAASGLGAAAMAAAALALATGRVDIARAATAVLLWGFVAPVFAIVAHRMLPFFTTSALPLHRAWRPDALLQWMLVALGATAAGHATEALQGPLPPAGQALLLAVQGPTAVLMLWLALRWGLVQSFSVRLLAMLHGGFVWLGLTFALLAVARAMALWQLGPGSLGLAPLHALTLGFLGCTLLAMITRVAAGHSGRTLVADAPALALYGAAQLAAVARVLSALWPDAPVALLLLAALAWAAAALGWAWRYGGWMGRPRADGRPG